MPDFFGMGIWGWILFGVIAYFLVTNLQTPA